MINKQMSIEIVKTIAGNTFHSDLVQFKVWINDFFTMMNDTENEINSYKRDCQLDYFKQLLNNGLLNALIVAYQNELSYNDLYQGTL